MPLGIRFVAKSVQSAGREFSVQLHLKENQELELPEIQLYPEGDAVPQVSQINFQVTGTPSALAEYLKREVYVSKSFEHPLAIGGARSLRPAHKTVSPTLLEDARCMVEVRVTYTEPAAAEQGADEQTAAARCYLSSHPAVALERKAIALPADLRVVDGGETQVVTVSVTGPPPDAPPSLKVKVSDDAVPDAIRRQVSDALARASSRAFVVERGDGYTKYEIGVGISLDEQGTRALSEVINKSLALPVEVETPGVEGCEFRLKLVSLEPVFPGRMAIDFGTSASTVTLWDFGRKGGRQAAGIAPEQSALLRAEILEWLRSSPADAVPGAAAVEWETFRRRVETNLAQEGHGPLGALRATSPDITWHAVMRQIELSLSSHKAEEFRRAASSHLQRLYQRALRAPSLRYLSLTSVVLDADKGSSEILSEMEITRLGDDPLRVALGPIARQHRRAAIYQGQQARGGIDRFIHSPKRFLTMSKKVKISLGGREEELDPIQIPKAAWARLIQLTEEARAVQGADGGLPTISRGAFRDVIVTYPTAAPPTVRTRIRQALGEMDITSLETAYDEATAAAVFYLWQEFSGSQDISLEGFKAFSRRAGAAGDRWVQNVMVIDVGGGTTDLALLQIMLEDRTPPLPESKQGAAGRYYLVTPKLLRSSGNVRLGGELITLRTFLLLKAAVADHLMTLAQEEGVLQSQHLSKRLTELPEGFLDGRGRYIQGSLRQRVAEAVSAQDDPERAAHPEHRIALNAVEQILPTRWKDVGEARLQTFYILWDLAEEAKKQLGQRRETGEESGNYLVGAEEVRKLLTQLDPNHTTAGDGADLSFTFTREEFVAGAAPVVSEIVDIAEGLLRAWQASGGAEEDKQIDWVIISGKSGHLEMIDNGIRNTMAKVMPNFERITFVPEYAKLATSIGAAFIERAQQLLLSPEAAINILLKGINQVDINVKNLFYFLPCSFVREIDGAAGDPIFEAGAVMKQLDAERIGKVRNPWEGIQLTNIVRRVDYGDQPSIYWGRYDANTLMRKLNMSRHEVREKYEIRYEVNHELTFKVFVRTRGALKHYSIPRGLPTVDLIKGGVAAPPAAAAPQPAGLDSSPPDVLKWDVAVYVQESNGQEPWLVFQAGTLFDRVLHVEEEEGRELLGLVSRPLPPFPKHGHRFYVRRTPEEDWRWIGIAEEPGGEKAFERDCFATVDQEGQLRLHAGSVPYWTTSEVNFFKEHDGCVLVDELEQIEPEPDHDREPFNGEH